MFKRLLIYCMIQEIFIVLMMLLQQPFSLFQYINLSFYIGFFYFLLLVSWFILCVLVFLDRVHDGFRKVSRKFKGEEDNEFSDTPLSELVGIPYLDIIFSSLIILASSLVALLIYYL